jgi:hypothetical protein
MLALPSLPLFAAEELRLEGVMLDQANPAESLAIINGQFVKQGDLVGEHRVTEVMADFAVVRHEKTGELTRLAVTAAPPPAAAEADAKVMPKTMGEKIQDFMAHFLKPARPAPGMPPRVKAQAAAAAEGRKDSVWERRAVLDLQQIYQAGYRYFSDFQRRPESLEVLMSAGYLAGGFVAGKKGRYRFYLDNDLEEPGVRADPVDSGEGLPYLFIDKAYVLRAEKNGPAGYRSPAYESPLHQQGRVTAPPERP